MNFPTEPTVARERDPVCGMNVRGDAALEDGLVVEHDGHAYSFCRTGCRDAFLASPEHYITSHRHAAKAAPAGAPQIDEGMRRWYESCSCCLSDAYPDVKAALDAEQAATHAQKPGPGICEVAEAGHDLPDHHRGDPRVVLPEIQRDDRLSRTLSFGMRNHNIQ